MKLNTSTINSAKRVLSRKAGFSLEEVVMAMALTTMCFAGSVKCYTMASQRAEWATCSQAAQSAAFQRLQQTEAAKWDTRSTPVMDDLVATNFLTFTDMLDMPLTSVNGVTARIDTTITDITLDPPLRMIQVDCVWTNNSRQVFTNTLISYRSPDQ